MAKPRGKDFQKKKDEMKVMVEMDRIEQGELQSQLHMWRAPPCTRSLKKTKEKEDVWRKEGKCDW